MVLKIYTKEEVLEHKTINDCWIIIKNKIYNITNYLTIHPGGKNILLQIAGKDCTEYFNNINHSKKAIIELDDSLLTPNELRAKREQQNFNA